MSEKLFFVSLGCDKNRVDSEVMLGLAAGAGYELTQDEAEADYIIVNTCCFIGDAKEESINTLLEMAQYKESGKLKGLIAAGCLAERYKEEILKEMPEVDAVIGTASYPKIISVIEELEKGNKGSIIADPQDAVPEISGRILTTGGHYAYLKIAEGCDKHCTYCIIPKVRGAYRSVPMETLTAEAAGMAVRGVTELILIAQETTLYGTDLYGKKMLPELLRRLSQISGIRWIRLQYCYPEEITDELIEEIRTNPKVCHYLDIPIQHASDRILKKMGRRTTLADIKAMIARLRKEIPDIALRTTFISGFPTETEEDHEILMDFVNETEFDRLGVFAYSREEDTPAAEMDGQVPEEVKEARRDEVMELQQEIAFVRAEAKIGKEYDVIVEGSLPDEGVYVCRTYMDAPDVDGYLFMKSEISSYMSGDFARARVTGAREYDLVGEDMCLQEEFS